MSGEHQLRMETCEPVASHLYRIFPKIGVTTRGQLARAWAAQPAQTSPTDDRLPEPRHGPARTHMPSGR
jgi:hypothetical protein